MGYFRFFSQTGLFLPCTLPYELKKYFSTKNPLNYYLLKVTKFRGDSAKNENPRTNKLKRVGGANPPPPFCLRLKGL